jgi:predicted RecB family nuclease
VEKISPSDLRHFALAVIAYTGTYASIVVYDKNLEGLILQSLALRFPDLKNELDQLKAKLVDISEVFKKLHYYHPDFRGSFSLKTLISVLVPEFNYEGIASGLAAMDEYAGFLKEENLIHREITRARLQQYCEGDARATHLLHIFLEEIK